MCFFVFFVFVGFKCMQDAVLMSLNNSLGTVILLPATDGGRRG